MQSLLMASGEAGFSLNGTLVLRMTTPTAACDRTHLASRSDRLLVSKLACEPACGLFADQSQVVGLPFSLLLEWIVKQRGCLQKLNAIGRACTLRMAARER